MSAVDEPTRWAMSGPARPAGAPAGGAPRTPAGGPLRERLRERLRSAARDVRARIARAAPRALDAIGPRIAVALTSATLTLVLAGTAISYTLMRDLSREKELAWMSESAQHEAAQIAFALGEFDRVVASLAAESAISAAVVDSEGRNRHLDPFLRLLAVPLERQFSQSAPGLFRDPKIAVLDYRGRPLAGTAGATGPAGADAALAGLALADRVRDGRSHASYDAASRRVVLAYPVIYPATGQAEGILVGELTLARRPQAGMSGRWQESVGDAPGVRGLLGDPSMIAVAHAVPMPERFRHFSWMYTLAAPRAALDAEARAILQPYLGLALVGSLLAVAIGLVLGRWAGRPIEQLAAAARELPARLEEPGPPALAGATARASVEVRTLAGALDDAFARVQRSTAEARLAKAALDAARDGIVLVDARAPELPLLYVNRAFEETTGYAARDVLGRNCRFLHGGEAAQPGLATLRAAIARGEPAQVLLRNFRADGTLFWNELAIAPLRDAQGTLTHFVGLQKDVTERLAAEEHLRTSQRLEALGQLTGGLAHDFNNLLGIVIGNLDLLVDDPATRPEARTRVDTALQAALRGADVTRSLLAVARRQRLAPEPVEVNDRLADMLPLLRNTAGKRVAVIDDPRDTPLQARLDPAGFDAALLNLVINARDAMPEGGTLALRTRELRVTPGAPLPAPLAELEPGRYARIEIEDNGCGMSEETRRRAFDPFFTTKPAGQGSGLGLAMVYGFARQSGGTATLDPAPGGGTIVRLYLPVAELV